MFVSTPASFSALAHELAPVRADLARRLAGPQRHRLLQGYPQVALMRSSDPAHARRVHVPLDTDRELILGVLPHPFCNPQLSGCGFCTFPHQRYASPDARSTVEAVIAEVRARTEREAGLAQRKVSALYFGGGTANLTPPNAFAALGATLADAFDLRGAELSLEGAPIYFLTRQGAILDAFDGIPAQHRRLSMGVQTFDPTWLERMGRTHFGDREVVAQVVREAHARGMTVSCDLMINLPGQSAEDQRRDLETALELGFDQVCVYHLVLFRGLGTAWSKDPDMLAQLPDNGTAFANWRQARAFLLERGFVQATLTNFERAELHATDRRFRYEELSFTPATTDGVGFGPAGITVTRDSWQPSDPLLRRAIKRVSHTDAAAYREAIAAHGAADHRDFVYTQQDMQLLHVTRSLPRLVVDRAGYRADVGSELADDFAPQLAALAEADLVRLDPDAVRLTERGMFYADSVAGLLAHERVTRLRSRRRLPSGANDAGTVHMG